MPNNEHFEGDYFTPPPEAPAPEGDPALKDEQLSIMDLPESAEPVAPAESVPATADEPQKAGFAVPERIRAQVEAAQAEAERAIDRVDDQAQTTTGFGTRQRAKVSTPEDEDILAGIAARRIVARSSGPSTKKPYRGKRVWDPKGGGPPANIAREIREGYPPEDGDSETN